MTVTMPDALHSDLVIRLAIASDASRLGRLAQLDSARIPAGEVLIVEVDGQLRAAVSLHAGEAIADPFHRTAGLVALLRIRAAQLAARDPALANSLSALEHRSAHLRSAKPLAALRRLA